MMRTAIGSDQPLDLGVLTLHGTQLIGEVIGLSVDRLQLRLLLRRHRLQCVDGLFGGAQLIAVDADRDGHDERQQHRDCGQAAARERDPVDGGSAGFIGDGRGRRILCGRRRSRRRGNRRGVELFGDVRAGRRFGDAQRSRLFDGVHVATARALEIAASSSSDGSCAGLNALTALPYVRVSSRE